MDFKRIAYKSCLMSAVAVLAGAVAVAQMPPSGQQQPGAGQQAPQQPTAQPGQPGQGPGAYPGAAPTSQDFAAKAFISHGLEGDQSEVQMGQLAQQKSQSNDVKQLAQKLVNDHTQMDEKWFKPLAKQLGVSEPKGPSKKDKKMAEKMQALSGNDFDTQYLTMMLKDHQKDLKEFQDEANSAQDPSVKQVAQQGANLISQHLQLVEQVAKNHNINTGESAKSSSM
ncbi:MAG TPA: DUF4142 domain-containing protein [Terracidiphilus sp.]